MSGCSKFVIGIFALAAALTFTLTAEHGEGSAAGVSGRYAIAGIFWLLGIALVFPWGRSVTSRLAAGGVGVLLVGLNIWQIVDGEFRPVALIWGLGGICAILYALSGEVPEIAQGFLGSDEPKPRPKKKRRTATSETRPKRKKKKPRTLGPPTRPRRPPGG